MSNNTAAEVCVKKSVIPVFDYTWTYEIRKGDDKIKSKLKYSDSFEGWEKRVPVEDSEHPDIRGLYLVAILADRQEGLIIGVTLEYESNDWELEYPGRRSKDKSQERFSIEPGISEESILSLTKGLSNEEIFVLRKFMESDRLGDAYNEANGAIGGNEIALEFLNAIKDGQESVRIPQVIWCRKRTIRSLAELPLEKVGKIDEPPKDKKGQPETPDGYNWMYLAPDVQDSNDGKSYDVVERWQRSNPTGWNEFFYDPESGFLNPPGDPPEE